ncbi:MAG: FecR domain-containing protein [Proteobacteria bacterium]|jgi:hypothetical protein|nr:FecR domain-containing protein [Pseudomonadota bacterium]
MRRCDLLERFLDRRLGTGDAADFEAHLADCRECAATVERWRGAARDLADASPLRSAAVPTQAEARRLVEMASARPARSGRTRLAVAAAAALVLGGAIAIALIARPLEPARSADVPAIEGTLFAGTGARALDAALLLKAGFTVPNDGRANLRIGNDTIDFSSGSKFALVQITETVTRVRLDSGSATCAVEKRGAGREFLVDADDYRVRVTGTRFTVAIASPRGVDVIVRSGTVEISREGSVVGRLAAGDRRVFPEREAEVAAGAPVPEIPAEPLPGVAPASRPARVAAPLGAAAPGIETLRAWIVGGQFADAEAELRARLGRTPSDVEARSLLADCLRKQLRWGEAAAVYRDVASAGDPVLSPRARSLLRDILADHPESAEGKAPAAP